MGDVAGFCYVCASVGFTRHCEGVCRQAYSYGIKVFVVMLARFGLSHRRLMTVEALLLVGALESWIEEHIHALDLANWLKGV